MTIISSSRVSLVGSVRGGKLRVSVPPREVRDRLQAELDADPALGGAWGYWLSRHHRFYGQVSSTAFRIHKWSGGRRPDAPALVGTIRPDHAGSVISFGVRPASSSLLFLAAFAVVWGVLWTVVLPGHLFGEWGEWARAGIAALTIPPAVLFWWLFRTETRALLGFLEERLGDVEVSQVG